MVMEFSTRDTREKLTLLPELLEKESAVGAVTRRGKRVLAVMPWHVYESILETMEILGDEAMKAFREGVRHAAEGKTRPVEELWAKSEAMGDAPAATG